LGTPASTRRAARASISGSAWSSWSSNRCP
jgi:hypothetical protein